MTGGVVTLRTRFTLAVAAAMAAVALAIAAVAFLVVRAEALRLASAEGGEDVKLIRLL